MLCGSPGRLSADETGSTHIVHEFHVRRSRCHVLWFVGNGHCRPSAALRVSVRSPREHGEGRVHARWSRVFNSSVECRRRAPRWSAGLPSGPQLCRKVSAGRSAARYRTPGSARPPRSRGVWSVRTIVSSAEAPVRMPTSPPVARRSPSCGSISAKPKVCSPTPATQDCGYGD
jgi:hypothetical protein